MILYDLACFSWLIRPSWPSHRRNNAAAARRSTRGAELIAELIADADADADADGCPPCGGGGGGGGGGVSIACAWRRVHDSAFKFE